MQMIPLPESNEYFILCIREAELLRDTPFLWWAPNDAGYTYDLNKAGRYDRNAVLDKRDYYHNGLTTLAIPCAVAEQISQRTVPFEQPIVGVINEARHLVGWWDKADDDEPDD